jgi:hypothetical protein
LSFLRLASAARDSPLSNFELRILPGVSIGPRGEPLKRLDDFRGEACQFLVVWGRQAPDQFLPLLGEGEEDLAAIMRRHFTYNDAAIDELIDNAYCAMVADLQLLREVADG